MHRYAQATVEIRDDDDDNSDSVSRSNPSTVGLIPFV